MSDYKRMYLRLVGEVANAIDRLQAVMRECEDVYINSDDPEITCDDEPPIIRTK